MENKDKEVIDEYQKFWMEHYLDEFWLDENIKKNVIIGGISARASLDITAKLTRIISKLITREALARKEAVDDYKEGLREKICIKLCWYDWFTDQAQEEILKIIDK